MPLLETKGAASAQGFGLTVGKAAAVYIEDVFSTYLYTGQTTATTVNNGIDLATKGGMVWTKARTSASDNYINYTDSGASSYVLRTNTTSALGNESSSISSWNTNGFTGWAGWNPQALASWTFRKQPKFFDVVTGTGPGTFNHNLGSVPGCIIWKLTNGAGVWYVAHNGLSGGINGGQNVQLQSTGASALIGSFSATSTTINTNAYAASTDTWVAYLFAHNAGGFGLTGTDNVISCGSYTGNGSATGPTVTLGYEPQWVMVKASGTTGNWVIEDTMRGMSQTSSNELFPNTSGAETALNPGIIPTATGFSLGTTNADMNSNGATYIYIAIRRGPMKTPTTGTSVFAPVTYTGNGSTNTVTSNFPVDLSITKYKSSNGPKITVIDRLRGFGTATDATKYLFTSATDAEGGASDGVTDMGNTGLTLGAWSQTNFSSADYIDWMFRRAPGFFDVVCYTGTGVSRQISISASFGSFTPELVIYKNRSNTTDWVVWPGVIVSANNYLTLNSTAAIASDATIFPGAFDIGFIRVGTNSRVNASGDTYVAYVFASCPGVSKVGSYTGNGSSQTINCGFTGGARFVLIKRTDASGDWVVFDSARGIVAGNDPFLELNTTAAEQTGQDAVDADSTGFIVNQTTENLNVSAASYIFLAIS